MNSIIIYNVWVSKMHLRSMLLLIAASAVVFAFALYDPLSSQQAIDLAKVHVAKLRPDLPPDSWSSTAYPSDSGPEWIVRLQSCYKDENFVLYYRVTRGSCRV